MLTTPIAKINLYFEQAKASGAIITLIIAGAFAEVEAARLIDAN
jgi:hypothetical protein